MTYFLIFGRAFFLVVFAASAILKVRDFRSFERHMAATLPRLRTGVPLLARGVIAVEAVGALSMLLPAPLIFYGFILVLLVCAGFTAYVVNLVRKNGGESCGCMGESRVPASRLHVLRNVVLLLLASVAAVGSWPTAADGPGLVADHLIAAVPAIGTAAAVVLFDDLIALFTLSPKDSD
ncbi:MauE/DoxX family redox-associated membrane protein [Streptomyces sp. PvR034]|uniref:MauE/DoxX family redox-associated membrane protein n=1 Tax=Streptomyces sp. PvR034 TaxID=3156401 RepID=UPI0033950AEC